MTSYSNIPPQVSSSATIEDDKNIPPGVLDQVLGSVPYYFIQPFLSVAVVVCGVATPVVEVSTIECNETTCSLPGKC